MPNQNGMGPQGNGPRTGRGLGPCPGPKLPSGAPGRGLGLGQGLGRGLGRGLGLGRGPRR